MFCSHAMRKLSLMIIIALLIITCLPAYAENTDSQYIITGEKSQIINTPITIAPWSRFVFTSDDQYAECTFYIDNEESKMPVFVTDQTTITSSLIQSHAPWKLDFSPMQDTDSPYMKGSNNYISDFFTLESPVIINITYDFPEDLPCTYYSIGCTLGLFTVYPDGTTSSRWFDNDDYVQRGSSSSYDWVIKPDPKAQKYFWFVSCNGNGINWNITPQQ